jgi:PhnB protein
MDVNPYLMFNGRCEEAIEFYRQAAGADNVRVVRFSDAPPEARMPGAKPDQLMHASFTIGDTHILASDGPGKPGTRFDGFYLSINAGSEAEAKKVFGALSAGGEVRMPLAKTHWTSAFGMLVDKFGVPWMVSVAH